MTQATDSTPRGSRGEENKINRALIFIFFYFFLIILNRFLHIFLSRKALDYVILFLINFNFNRYVAFKKKQKRKQKYFSNGSNLSIVGLCFRFQQNKSKDLFKLAFLIEFSSIDNRSEIQLEQLKNQRIDDNPINFASKRKKLIYK